MSEIYGKELILDLHKCDPGTFNRDSLRRYFSELCVLIDMEACALHFWDDIGVPYEEKQTDSRTKGTSAVQFILTSSITIHTLELVGKVYVNLFSCKEFDSREAAIFTTIYFKGETVNYLEVNRL